MIELIYNILQNINPFLLIGIGVIIGIATDESGRILLKKFAQKNVDNILDSVDCSDEVDKKEKKD